MKIFRVVFVVMGLSACSPPAPDDSSDKSRPAAAENAAARDGGERFYGRETFTIVTSQTGHEAGSVIEHVRDWGRRRAEIKDATLRVSGVTQRINTRGVFEGPQVTTINLDDGAVSTMTNPVYDQVVANMRGRDGVEFGRQIMTQMGGRATGERGSFAGHDCEYWEIQQLGSRSCVTPWGATLYNRTSLAGVTIERTATQVRLGDGGPDAAFAYDASRATRVPDLGDLMGKMKGN